MGFDSELKAVRTVKPSFAQRLVLLHAGRRTTQGRLTQKLLISSLEGTCRVLAS